jgi:hypothetical protein
MNPCGHSPYVTSSLTKGWIFRLQLLLALASAVILKSDLHGTFDHILLSQIRGSPNLEGQAPIFISPRNRVAQLYPQALGSLSIVFYDSQDYVGGFRILFHTGHDWRQSQSHIATDGQSSQSWCRAPSGAHDLGWPYVPFWTGRYRFFNISLASRRFMKMSVFPVLNKNYKYTLISINHKLLFIT